MLGMYHYSKGGKAELCFPANTILIVLRSFGVCTEFGVDLSAAQGALWLAIANVKQVYPIHDYQSFNRSSGSMYMGSPGCTP